ncbi:MAG: TIGR00296 family protein [Nitrososphaeria archaeon]
MKLNDEDGKALVKLARKIVEEHVMNKIKYKPTEEERKRFSEKFGVFVTINEIKGEKRELRGCIGYPRPLLPLIDALIDSAICAASEDPRFEPVHKNELDKIVIEVSVLTPLELIEVNSPLEYPKKIKIGEDGLVIELEGRTGLLLPQVPIEYGWTPDEYLEYLCMKAGLTPDSWLRKDAKIFKFQSLIWEETPDGKAVRKRLLHHKD